MKYEAPNSNYEKFFQKMLEFKTLEVNKWNKNHLIGYFCQKYYDKYNEQYSFKFNTEQPSKCFEVFTINKILIGLTSDSVIIKQYIDWVFNTKVKNAKRKLTSISFLTNESEMNFFKTKYLNNSFQIDRTTILPDNVKAITNLSTYGDLAFMLAIDCEESNKIKELLTSMGFDINVLSKVK